MPTDLVVPRGLVVAPSQPMRMSMSDEKLLELESSIRRHGILQPLLVTPTDASAWDDACANGAPLLRGYASTGGHLEIIDGHRRYVAGARANVEMLPVRVFTNVEDARYAMMLDATACHEDFTAAEEGVQFLELAEKHHWNEEQLCQHFRRSEDYINERVRLVQEFPDLFPAVSERAINWSQAKAIMRCKDKGKRAYLVEQASTHGASARTLTYMVEQFKTDELLSQGKPAMHTPEHARFFTPAENPRCVYCSRDDDPSNITTVPVHSYHVRDLTTVLERIGLAAPTQAASRS